MFELFGHFPDDHSAMALLPSSLRYFEMVARERSIRRAAIRLNVAPSAVNRQVLRLEQELGVPIFERLPRGMRLTQAGELLLLGTQQARRELDVAVSKVDALRGVRRGHVTIATLQFMMDAVLPSVIAVVRRSFPGITLSVSAGSSAEIVRGVSDGEVDCGVCWSPRPGLPLTVLARIDAPFGALVRRGHPLATRGQVRLRDCLEFPLIFPARGMELRALLDRVLAGFPSAATPVVETSSLDLMLQLARNGTGVAVVSAVAVPQSARRDLVHLPFVERAFSGARLAVFIRRNRALPLAASTVLETLVHRLRELEEARPDTTGAEERRRMSHRGRWRRKE